MDRHDIRKMFGRKPSLDAVLIWSLQQALKGIRAKHPDGKRQRRRKERDLMLWGARKVKRG
jgi:hypothetical protein